MRFWRGLAIFLLGGMLGTGFGVALGFFFYPFIFPPPPAMEQLSDADRAVEVAPTPLPAPAPAPQPDPLVDPIRPPAMIPVPPPLTAAPPTASPAPAVAPAPSPSAPTRAVAAPVAIGTFIHANPSDPVHWGRGRVSVYERVVFLEADFQVGPGPAFRVLLVPKAGIRSSAEVKDEMYVDLGGLRAFKGSQRYPIPAGVDLGQFQSVVIWCERFSVLISPADLKPATR